MPTRYLKPGIRDSELIDSLSPMAENLFYRLLVTVDDFGRADARPSMVKASCFPIKDGMTTAKCADLLRELASKGVVLVYEHMGKPYVQMSKWDNAPRAKESKFPAPTNDCAQLHTNACNTHAVLPVTVTVTVTETENREPETETDARASAFDVFWLAYPKKVGKGDAEKAWKKVKEPSAVVELILDALNWQKASTSWLKDGGQFVPNPATYLNRRGWEDEPTQSTAGKISKHSGFAAMDYTQGIEEDGTFV